MACPNKNRHRPRTVAFRLTDEEFMRLEQRVKVTGEVKGDYLREIALNGEIKINVGKFKSDKLALAIKGFTNEIQKFANGGLESEIMEVIEESNKLLHELYMLVQGESFSTDSFL